MNSIVVTITIYPAKGKSGIEQTEAHLIENKGLEGDFHAVGGDRQLSLLVTETQHTITGQTEKGLCFSRYRENITITGIDTAVLRPGVRLLIGEAVIEITGEMKHCHVECSLYETGKRCPLAGMNLFAKVVKTGIIRKDDPVTSGVTV